MVVRLTQSLEMEEENGIAGLVLHRGHLVVTHYDHRYIYVYQAARFPACKHQVGLRDPLHMMTVTGGDNDYLVISDSHTRRLHWVPMLVEGAELKLGAVRTIQLDYKPCV